MCGQSIKLMRFSNTIFFYCLSWNCNNDSTNILLWKNHARISILAVTDRREIRSVSIQEETERYKSEQGQPESKKDPIRDVACEFKTTSDDYTDEFNISPSQKELSPEIGDYCESKLEPDSYYPDITGDPKSQKNNPFSYTNDDIMDIRGEGGFSKFLSVDDYVKLLSKKPKREIKLPEDWSQLKNNDSVSDFERQFDEITQTKSSPLEVAKKSKNVKPFTHVTSRAK
ncbi:hypothetical protein Glove_63g76 [Diversispora epigaea]|uniref:Uncharacterized protein n=1 Tax=Diversispora epigaea TaxID=1348612 RepID=A0A397JFL9_9GLOM|nr:hypothetical protein Glove_63g76 [Diversispora epigaea]